jgi:hypothetical protein
MCDFGIGEYAAIAALAAGAGATYYGQTQSNAAMASAADNAMAAQRGSQLKQLQYQGEQDAAQQHSRDIFQNQTLAAINPDTVQANEASQQARVGGILNAATTAQASNADPTRAPDAVSTVGAPTSGGADSAGSKAYDASYANNIARAISFNTQQAGAQANITGRQFAAADQQRALERAGQGIYQNNDQIAGLSNLITGQGRLMDAQAAAGQAQIGAASHKGDDWKTTGSVLSAIGGILGGGWGSAVAGASQSGAIKGKSASTTNNSQPVN